MQREKSPQGAYRLTVAAHLDKLLAMTVPSQEDHPMRLFRLWTLALMAISLVAASVVEAAETADLLRQIKSVGPRGEGNVAAQTAAKQLSRAPVDVLIEVLAAGDDANPLAMNWLRGVFEAVAQRTIEEGDGLPVDQLEAFVVDQSHAPRVRRLAYEWLAKVDPTAPDRIIPTMLADSSDEMRRDAVARLIESAKQFETDGAADKAKATFEQALTGAVDKDQVDTLVTALGTLGETIDVVQHFGLLTSWQVIGPFDNHENKGFDVAYPPEEHLDFAAEYEGQLGPVRWQEFIADSDEGLFDIGKLIENYKGSAMYLTTTFPYDRAREVEFRLTTKNAWKLWLNGELLFAREEYHRGTTFDQYRVRGTLKPGENVILLKVLQNEQEEDWAQDYHFKFRVCDFSGRAIHPTTDRRAAKN